MARPGTLYEYTLQTSSLPCGSVILKLYSELNGLTIPDFASLSPEDDIVERIDVVPGEYELQEMNFSFVEDYTTYSEGFWYKVLTSYAEIQIGIDEGTGTGSAFWGRVQDWDGELTEHSLVSGALYRTGKFSTVSMMIMLKEATAADVVTEAKTHYTAFTGSTEARDVTGTYEERFVKFEALMASILKVAFGQTYGTTYVSILPDPYSDLQFYDGTGTTFYDLQDIYFWMGYSPGSLTYEGYFDSTDTTFGWAYQFGSAWDLLVALSRNLLFVPRITGATWGAGAYLKMECLTRGRSYGYSTFEAPFESKLITRANAPIHVVYSSHYDTSFDSNKKYVIDGVHGDGDLPEHVDADMTFETQFVHDGEVTFGADKCFEFLYILDDDTTPSYAHRVTDMQYLNYDGTPSYDVSYSYLVGYYYNRFAPLKRAYIRSYATMQATVGATTSLNQNEVLHTTQINDGASTRDFYAVEVRKNIQKNESTVRWHEV